MSELEPRPGKVLSNIILRCRQSGDFSDLTILCGEARIEVHKMIVCPQSKVLNAACTIGFKETFSGEFSMQEDCLFLVEKMVDFFYTNDYRLDPSDAENSDNGFPDSPLQIHARMFALADKYDIGGLCILASSKYFWELIDLNSLVDFFGSVHDVYMLTPASKRNLRERVIEHVREKLPVIREGPILQESLLQLLEDLPEFAHDLLLAYIRSPAEGNCSDCGWRAIEILQARCLGCRRGGVHTYR